MNPANKSKERQHAGEVFTPATTVFEMVLNPNIRDVVISSTSGCLDPCAGQGQFPCAVLFWRLFFNLDRLTDEFMLTALDNINAIDIREDNVQECKEHLLQTFIQTYEYLLETKPTVDLILRAKSIINKNVLQGDFLKVVKDVENE